LSAVAKALGMYCFSDRYRQGVGSYLFLNLLRAAAKVFKYALFFDSQGDAHSSRVLNMV
jgi:hypothetical protein